MKEYEEIYKAIRKYFANLGYAETMFESDVAFSNQFSNVTKVDFIVKQANAPFIVVEAKLAKTFDNINNEKLKYDPSVRQVQTYAMSLNAPYYVVTNGNSFLWFETDEDGRPCKIDPIRCATMNTTNASFIPLNEAFNYCRDLLRQDTRTSDVMYELTLILLARFAVKDSVAPQDIPYQINRIIDKYYACDIELISQVEERVLEKCWYVLSECKPENAEPKQIINSLKLFCQKIKDQKSTFRLGEKLSTFLVKLAMIDDDSVILDPVANLGEITSKIILQNRNSLVYTYCQSKEMYAFDLLQQQIINKNTKNVHLISYEDFIKNACSDKKSISPDRIITAFPFGNRSNFSELRHLMPVDLTNIEDFMLVSSLQILNPSGRLVALVPDSMLFAGGKRERLRSFIAEQFCLRSIISLPVGAISNSNTKTSIVVIDKFPKGTNNVFFGIVKDTETNLDFSSSEFDNVSNNLLKAYEQSLSNNIVEESIYWKISPIDTSAENLRAETYISISDLKIESDYPLRSINEICKSIERGTALKIDPNGDIPVLGPASIRPNVIDSSKFTLTSMGNVTKSLVYTKKGNIVFNNISSYLGSAALVESDIPTAINQHVLSIVPNTDIILPQYLAIALNSRMVNDFILKSSTGAVIPSITLANFRGVQVPVPDLETQEKIVSSVNNIKSEIAKLEESKKVLELKLNSVIDKLAPEEV